MNILRNPPFPLAALPCLASLLFAPCARALPSDALLDSLALASAEHEQFGRLDARDQTESLLETLSRQRIAADSAPAHPHKILEQIDLLRDTRAKREADELSSLRPPVPEVARMRESDTNPDQPNATIPTPAPPAAVAAPTLPPNAAKPAALCPSGLLKIEWLRSSPHPEVHEAPDSIVPVGVRITAPCGLSRIDLFLDENLARSFPVPTSSSGTFEFADRIAMSTGIHRLDILACDTAGTCTRSAPLESKVTKPVSPWIPRTVGGLVGLCILMGIALSLRKLSLHAPSHRSSASAVPLPQSSGVSATLRHRLQLVAKEIGPAFPAVSLRLPDAPADLTIDPESLGEVFGNILRLHARRAKSEGQLLVAIGQGPLSTEIVFEDTAPTPDEEVIQLLLDPSKTRLKERMDLDQELDSARQLIARSNGSIAMEARIDGGLRTRIRLKLAPRNTTT
jgi:hypothetical protein